MSFVHLDPGGEYYYAGGGSAALNAAVTANIWQDNNGCQLVNNAPVGSGSPATDGNIYAIQASVGNGNVGKYLAVNQTQLACGYRLTQATIIGTANQQLIVTTLDNSIGTSQTDVRTQDTSGHLKITRNGTQIGPTSTQALPAGTNYIELRVTFSLSSSGGTAEVYVNNQVWITVTGAQTANTTAAANRVYFESPLQSGYMKDMYVVNPLVADPPTTVTGDILITPKFGTGAGSLQQFTPNVGPFVLTSVNTVGVYQGTITGGATNAYRGMKFTVTGFVNGANNQVNATATSTTATALTLGGTTITETHSATAAFVCLVGDGIAHLGTWPDGDTTYVFSSVTGNISDFTHEAIVGTATIIGVGHVSYMRKDEGGARSGAQVCKSGATTETSASFGLGTSWGYFFDYLGLDPNTGLAWTVAGFNAATFGAKVP